MEWRVDWGGCCTHLFFFNYHACCPASSVDPPHVYHVPHSNKQHAITPTPPPPHTHTQTVGALYVGPAVHYWFGFLDALAKKPAVAKRCVVAAALTALLAFACVFQRNTQTTRTACPSSNNAAHSSQHNTKQHPKVLMTPHTPPNTTPATTACPSSSSPPCSSSSPSTRPLAPLSSTRASSSPSGSRRRVLVFFLLYHHLF